MAEYRVPTQQELDRLLYMQGMQGKSNQQIIDENLARGSTIQALPENFFQTASAGARRVGNYVNQAGNLQQIVNKLFPSNIGNTQANVQIPTSFNFAPKQAPTGEVLPAGLQTQSVPVASILQAIKPADVLGISGAERAYGDIGAGKAPQPFDVVDTLGVGAGMTAAGRLAAKGGMAAGRYIAPELGNMAEQYAAKTGLLQSVKPIDVAGTGLLQTAPKSDIGFYSAVEQAAMASPRKSATGQAFLNDIMKGQDVRADEIKWMGLDDYLKGKQNVTKQEVQDYIANNRVDIQEVTLSDTGLRKKFSVNSPEDQDLYDVVDKNNKVVFTGNIDDADYFIDRSLTKFSQYTLPGGENYRELILTMPAKQLTEAEARTVLGAAPNAKLSAEDIAYASRKNANEYKSSHFPEQQNPLAHLRVNDRVDADGKKMLLIEEVQSDWHQTGREKGYQQQSRQASEINKDLDSVLAELRSKPGVGYAPSAEDWAKYPEITSRFDALEAELAATSKQNRDAVPDAPFKDTWYQLALKRAIQHAAENGYDRIGLTTGKQQAARYDLSKQLNSVSYRDGVLKGYDKNNELVINQSAEPKDLSNYVGKELASKMVESSTKNAELQNKLKAAVSNKAPKSEIDALRNELAKAETYYSGLDLQVGGEGMKKYYDEIYPKFLDKYGKKWGANVKEVSLGGESMGRGDIDNRLDHLPNGFKTTDGKFWEDYDDAMTHESNLIGSPIVRYLDITPEMKAGVSKGQPLFAAVPAIPAAGLLAPQEQKRR